MQIPAAAIAATPQTIIKDIFVFELSVSSASVVFVSVAVSCEVVSEEEAEVFVADVCSAVVALFPFVVVPLFPFVVVVCPAVADVVPLPEPPEAFAVAAVTPPLLSVYALPEARFGLEKSI